MFDLDKIDALRIAEILSTASAVEGVYDRDGHINIGNAIYVDGLLNTETIQKQYNWPDITVEDFELFMHHHPWFRAVRLNQTDIDAALVERRKNPFCGNSETDCKNFFWYITLSGKDASCRMKSNKEFIRRCKTRCQKTKEWFIRNSGAIVTGLITILGGIIVAALT